MVTIYQPTNPCYNNNIYLLQGVQTYSAAVHISAWFQQSGAGLVLGEETGGLTKCYIESILGELPNSKIKIRCSNKDFTWEGGKDGQGFLPDIPVEIDYGKSKFSIDELKEFVQLAKEFKNKKQKQ